MGGGKDTTAVPASRDASETPPGGPADVSGAAVPGMEVEAGPEQAGSTSAEAYLSTIASQLAVLPAVQAGQVQLASNLASLVRAS